MLKMFLQNGILMSEYHQRPLQCSLILQAHSINPYSSREERILFSTWNLDHVVERYESVTTVFPALCAVVVYFAGDPSNFVKGHVFP
jgi:hypothetical protein